MNCFRVKSKKKKIKNKNNNENKNIANVDIQKTRVESSENVMRRGKWILHKNNVQFHSFDCHQGQNETYHLNKKRSYTYHGVLSPKQISTGGNRGTLILNRNSIMLLQKVMTAKNNDKLSHNASSCSSQSLIIDNTHHLSNWCLYTILAFEEEKQRQTDPNEKRLSRLFTQDKRRYAIDVEDKEKLKELLSDYIRLKQLFYITMVEY